MNNSIKAELKAHILGMINDGVLTDDNQDDWHFHAFNESHYIIGYYQCSEWLKLHDVDVFDAVDTVREYEIDNFGEMNIMLNIHKSSKVNSEAIVNMYVYILGEELLSDINADTIEELKAALHKCRYNRGTQSSTAITRTLTTY
jgi:hypothetical protein